jgi:hypothetical protein
MNDKINFLKTAYHEKPKSPMRYTTKLNWKNDDQLRITPVKLNTNLNTENYASETYINKNKDCGVNTYFQVLTRKNSKYYSKDLNSYRKNKYSVSPEPRKHSPKLLSFYFDLEEKPVKVIMLYKKTRTIREKNNASPGVKIAEIKADLPRLDGKNLAIHNYALPQALIPIKTPTPLPKVGNILDEITLPKPHPISKKGFSGWKISLRKIYLKAKNKA